MFARTARIRLPLLVCASDSIACLARAERRRRQPHPGSAVRAPPRKGLSTCLHLSQSRQQSTRDAVIPRLAAVTTTLDHIRPSASAKSCSSPGPGFDVPRVSVGVPQRQGRGVIDNAAHRAACGLILVDSPRPCLSAQARVGAGRRRRQCADAHRGTLGPQVGLRPLGATRDLGRTAAKT